jgi:exodeoxyribonuclease VII large subunit
MLHGFTERCPTHVIVWPVRVQGETCAAEVAAAIRGFNAIDALSPFPKPDLLIVARGGGSLEDLWGFNEEAVVRAAAESAIPLISAVGHETDWTLIDLVADARAPTPTKAAEWAVPKHSDLVLRLSECIGRARHCIRRHLEGLRSEFRGAERGLPRPQNLLAIPRQRLDTAGARLGQSLRHFSDRSRGRYERCAVRLTPRLISAPLELLTGRLARAGEGAGRAFRLTVAKKRDRLDDRAERLQPGLLAVPAARQRERLQSLIARAEQSVRNALKRKASEAGSLSQLLRTLSHKSVLDRGFALVRDAEGHVIRRAEAAKAAVLLDIEFADGHVSAKLGDGEEAQETRAPERKSPAPPHRAKQLNKDDGSQGSLL